MNETPKIKSASRMRQTLLIWLASFTFIALTIRTVLVATDHAPKKSPDIMLSLLFGVLGASILVCLLVFIRWIGCWRNLRRALVGLAILATLIAIFYTVEDWRGKRAWENCKRKAEAEGVVLDWNKFIPSPVPDEQNFYTASTNILLKFKQLKADETNEIEAVKKISWLNLNPFNPSNSLPTWSAPNLRPILAQIIVSPQTDFSFLHDTNTAFVTLNDPNDAKRARDLIKAAIGPTIQGATGIEFSRLEPSDIHPAHIFVLAVPSPSEHDLEKLIPPDTQLQVDTTAGQRTYDVIPTLVHVPGITTAADYLKWSDQFVPAFDEIREALKRPYAIIPGDYSEAYSMPIPNFVAMRSLAQTLAQRAQCYLLLGEPDKALHELTLVHDVCRILEKPPAGQPETLVEAMINVAIAGLYTQIISEGLQRHAWQEPQLIALQEQLAEINLPAPVVRAFKAESAGTTHTLETIPPQKIARWFSTETVGARKPSLWQNITSGAWVLPLKMWLIPRGWIYQNMAVIGSFRWADGFDPDNETIFPAKIEENTTTLLKKIASHPSLPYNFLADIAIPNFSRAWQTTAYNQTLVNETQIACALERCRLEHGEYPDSLDMLVPKYIETLPHDIIGGQPLHYRRTEDRNFLLYSLGWNEKDDGGKQSPKGNNGIDFGQGDWVWKN